MRITHEISQWKDTSFVTLTYNNDNLPYNENAILPTLRKKDLQMFFKRLRSRIDKIKYFACGEYGDVTQRPHYHMILCGVGLSDEHKLAVIESAKIS